jgi:peptidoglycan-N-acetylglucosamine deacetylase
MTTVCLTFDFDAVSIWVSTFKLTGPTPVSRGEYGARIGVPRILELLTRKHIPATFFVPAHTAVSFPDTVRRIREQGHEIAVHGYCHESPAALPPDEETSLLRRSVTKLQSVVGKDFEPAGYRSPSWNLSNNSIAILVELGFSYDSSLMADDFKPYRPRHGDQIDEERFTAGAATRLLEMPVAWELDDFPYFHWQGNPLRPGLRSTEEVFSIWRAEFDYCHRHVDDGVFNLTTHPQVIGRGPRMLMLERLIDHMQSQEHVHFSTLADAAQRWGRLI